MGGGVFYAGKSLSNENEQAAVAGSVSGAMHAHAMAKAYDVPVILHTDHAARKLLPWVDGMLDAGEKFHEREGKPLYSSHMLDLSEEPIEDNLQTSKDYFERMNGLGMTIEIELGVTGGEEDGVDNTDIDSSRLYTQPEEVNQAYEVLSQVSNRFTVAAAFGNAHGVYKPETGTYSEDSSEFTGISQGKARPDGQADSFCFSRWVRFVTRADQGGDWVWSRKDELGYRHAVGVLVGSSRILRPKQRLPAGAAREPGRRRKAKQEIL